MMGGFNLPIFTRMQCVLGSLLAAIAAHATESLGTGLIVDELALHIVTALHTLQNLNIQYVWGNFKGTK